ncbi:MAG: methyltransferase domain-containing protein [Phycisphaera sp.]|nr:methyltransferase domain-containing protein [Phycisphaera sp.]
MRIVEYAPMVPPITQPGAWYVESFGEMYPLLYRHRDDESAAAEVRGLVGLMGVAPAARMLDICCGNGRHMATLLDMGFDVTGVDLSEAQLRRAAEREGFDGRLVQADVRDLPFDACFDAAVNLFTSFGYFESDDENAAALRQMARVLRAGGVLAMDLINRENLERIFEPLTRDEIDGVTVESRRSLTDQRSYKHTTVTDGDGRVHTFKESVRLYRPGEIAALFADAGLGDVRMYGDYHGRAFEPDAPRMIVIGTRV